MDYASLAQSDGSKPSSNFNFSATGMQIPSERRPEVLVQLNDLRDAVESLGSHLADMEGRLSPVTRQSPVDQAGGCAPEPTLVPLAGSLRDIRRNIEAYNSRMRYLAANIEL